MWEMWEFSKLSQFSVQIFIQAAKMEEEIFNLSKITQNDSKNIKRRIMRIKRMFSVHRKRNSLIIQIKQILIAGDSIALKWTYKERKTAWQVMPSGREKSDLSHEFNFFVYTHSLKNSSLKMSLSVSL